MTSTQYCILLGTIWLAPHAPRLYAFVMAGVFFLAPLLEMLA